MPRNLRAFLALVATLPRGVLRAICLVPLMVSALFTPLAFLLLVRLHYSQPHLRRAKKARYA